MAQIRKTRQQKIQISERRATRSDQAYDSVVTTDNTDPVEAIVVDGRDHEHDYVLAELRRIGWTSALCLVLLLAASLLLSGMGWIVTVRDWIGLPHLQF